ncbi:MAG: histidine kinase [Bacteroidota bacterium]
MKENSIQNKNKLLLSISYILGWSFFSLIQLKLLQDLGINASIAWVDALVSSLFLSLFSFLIINNMRYYLPGKERYWYTFIISLAISGLWLLIVRSILWIWFKENLAYQQFLSQTSNIRYAISFLLIGCITMISLLWYTQKDAIEIKEREQETQQLAKDAELFKLRQQLQPHFLFNSLNSISALAGTQPEKARHMIEQLSDFLRGTLKKDEQESISLQEEVDYLQLYLEIEKVRFGHRLETIITISETAAKMQLPALILQPIVENAIKFGLYDTTEIVTISIVADTNPQGLSIQVTNPYDANTSLVSVGTGFGLSSIQRRLFLLYGRNDLLKTTQSENSFISTLEIPAII